jgi:hypothetical protein
MDTTDFYFRFWVDAIRFFMETNEGIVNLPVNMHNKLDDVDCGFEIAKL